MKYSLLLVVFIFTPTSLISQEIKSLKNSDTIYYYFKHKKNEDKGKIRPYSKDIKSITYRVNIKGRMPHSFKYKTHNRIGEGDRSIPILTKNINFLKENRDKILCYTSLKKMKPEELKLLYWNSQNKVIYLIDKKENTDSEIFLRKVRWISGYLLEQ